MATHVTRGEGKLYEANSEKFISTVNYKIHEELTTEGTLAKWWGEITISDSTRVYDGDRYLIELEDERKGRCSLRRRVNRAVVLVPPRYIYLLQGTGALK